MNSPAPHRSILVIENNPEQLDTIISILHSSDHVPELTTVDNTTAALEFLNQQTTIPSADLILLNLDLPAEQGYNFLHTTKTNPQLRRIPVIVLSNAENSHDIIKTYTMQGNCHIVKTTDTRQLAQTIQQVVAFWLGVVTLPLE
jgi:two-component system, chemotaxis family, response regulator Rcp1